MSLSMKDIEYEKYLLAFVLRDSGAWNLFLLELLCHIAIASSGWLLAFWTCFLSLKLLPLASMTSDYLGIGYHLVYNDIWLPWNSNITVSWFYKRLGFAFYLFILFYFILFYFYVNSAHLFSVHTLSGYLIVGPTWCSIWMDHRYQLP